MAKTWKQQYIDCDGSDKKSIADIFQEALSPQPIARHHNNPYLDGTNYRNRQLTCKHDGSWIRRYGDGVGDPDCAMCNISRSQVASKEYLVAKKSKAMRNRWKKMGDALADVVGHLTPDAVPIAQLACRHKFKLLRRYCARCGIHRRDWKEIVRCCETKRKRYFYQRGVECYLPVSGEYFFQEMDERLPQGVLDIFGRRIARKDRRAKRRRRLTAPWRLAKRTAGATWRHMTRDTEWVGLRRIGDRKPPKLKPMSAAWQWEDAT